MPLTTHIIEETPTEKSIEATIDKEKAETYFQRAASFLSIRSPLKGFRPGKAPFDLCMRTFGDATIIREVMRMVLYEELPSLLKNETFRIMGEPRIRFSAIALQAPVVFTVTLGKYPEVIPLDYKTIVVKEKKADVKDYEITRTLDFIKRDRGVDEIDDALAKSLGNFKNVEDLKKSIKEGLLIDKETLTREKARSSVLDEMKKRAPIALPRFVIEQEAEKRVAAHKEEIEAKGTLWAEYLKGIKKSEEDLERDETDATLRLLENALILDEIARQEKITLSPQDVESALNGMLARYRDPKEAERAMDVAATKEKIAQQLLYEKVFQEVLDKRIEYV